jgi:hypothetical protein
MSMKTGSLGTGATTLRVERFVGKGGKGREDEGLGVEK